MVPSEIDQTHGLAGTGFVRGMYVSPSPPFPFTYSVLRSDMVHSTGNRVRNQIYILSP